MEKNNNPPKISVITPSFNQGAFLERTINSVIKQGYPNLEYIIIDGGSTDNSVEIIRKYEKYLKYWVSEKDKGQSQAFNKGLKIASGDIIGWLNSDDLYLDRCIFQGVEYFDRNPAIDIVFSDYYFIDGDNKIIKRRREIPFNYNIYLWTADCYHANCAGFFRRKVFDIIGGINEDLHYGMDYELYLRAAKSGLKFGHLKAYWGAYRMHGQSKSVAGYSLMKNEGETISALFYSAKISKFGLWWRKIFFKTLRIVWKFAIGSYGPSSKTSKKLINGEGSID